MLLDNQTNSEQILTVPQSDESYEGQTGDGGLPLIRRCSLER